ncbi:MAG: bacillithiol biosynthesis cysteine-adding enzyme BshC [Cytophagales bacterium]|nr:bacillithiol biosynthesis cysteine-adding enzyme BshC [Cytophagales bacterium]
MHITKIDYKDTGYFPQIFIDYIKGNKKLAPFYDNKPNINGFKDQIKVKNFPAENRQLLFEVLNEQYATISKPQIVTKNLKALLNPNTFTVTTGHQLNICCGPLYFIYKLITVINITQILNEVYPDHHFVPIYWMASEDHDFEEINHFHLFGETYRWTSDQKGATGRFKTNSLSKVINQIPEKLPLFESAYKDEVTLSAATRYFVNELFGEYGLIIIDGDDKRLKSQLKDVIIDELQNNSTEKLIIETSNKLSSAGYKHQVNPREINFFYLDDNLRERIVSVAQHSSRNKDDYKVLNTNISFTKDQILQLLNDSPEKFSPNVVTRPLYQELILPNLAYVGGPAEIAYWLQLKSTFKYHHIPFPILIPRNSALWINKHFTKKINKLNIRVKDLFLDISAIKDQFMANNSTSGLHPDKAVGTGAGDELKPSREQERIIAVLEDMKAKAKNVDSSLEGFVGAEMQKILKITENIEKKIKKAEENKYQTQLNQIENIKSKLYPEGVLQERKDNFLNFYINNPDFLKILARHFDPFDFRFMIFCSTDC